MMTLPRLLGFFVLFCYFSFFEWAINVKENSSLYSLAANAMASRDLIWEVGEGEGVSIT